MNFLNVLNAVIEGWKITTSGMLVNERNLDIIDIAPATKTWFIVSDHGTFEGFPSCEEAVTFYVNLSKS